MPPHLDPLEPRRLLSTAPAVPALSSRPSAPHTLYLDFDGDTTPTWSGLHPGTTPAYDTDGDPATFSPAELAAVRDAFARVADAYAPFNVNVTTVRPKPGRHRRFVTVVIGGSGDWLGGAPEGGIAQVGSFTKHRLRPYVFVFSARLNSVGPIADAIAHEAGHAFGLGHQSVLGPGRQVTAEYNPGGADTAPIMGLPYFAPHPRWWHGPTSSTGRSQDDLALLTRVLGRAPDDAPNSLAASKKLKWSGNTLSASGTIASARDPDCYTFTTPGGYVRAQVTTPGMLTPDAALLDAKGKVLLHIAGQYANSGIQLHAGTYRLRVRPGPGYGNLGRYTVSVMRAPAGPTGLTATLAPGAASYAADLAWTYAGPNADAFLVLRADGDAPGAPFDTVATLAPDAARYTDVTLLADTAYTYQVVAVINGIHSAPAAAAIRTARGLKFVPARQTTVPGPQVGVTFTATDFNGDGRADLMASDGRALLNAGNGTFTGPIPGGPPPYDRWRPDAPIYNFAVADRNHDGCSDVIRIEPETWQITTYYGSRDGTLHPSGSVPMPGYLNARGHESILPGDFNGDGTPDLYFTGEAVVLFGLADGNFAPSPFGTWTSLDRDSERVADFNRDGRDDLMVPVDGNTFSIYLSNGDGSFRSGDTYPGDARYRAAIADLNGDHLPDLVAYVPSGADGPRALPRIFFANPDGSLSPGPILPTSGDGALVAVDLNRDGRADLFRNAVTNAAVRTTDAFLSRPDGTFAHDANVHGTLASFSGTPVVADFDGDGTDELLAMTVSFYSEQIFFNLTPVGFAG